MELKRVEIVGFKSFPEKISVEFDRGITAIVGPNGSGKSNIADAVKWVLGEQSAKSLRGAKMEDVIFAGTERRRPLGFAEVTLVLDNHDKKMPVDYDEVHLRRRLFRSGESEYAINGGKCRLRDIQELIMDTGIGKDGYSMIGQGQIDRLLSSKPQDRRMIFEEAAGITKYKTRREQAEKKLTEDATQLVRVEDILHELSLREETLKSQAETAEKYLGYKEELKFYEVSAFLGEYDQLKQQYDKAAGLIKDNEIQIEASKEAREQARLRSQKLQESSLNARNDLSAMEQLLTDLKLENEKEEGDKRVLLGKIEHEEEVKNSLSKRLEEIKARIRDRNETREKELAKIEAFQQEEDEKNTDLLGIQEEIKEKQAINREKEEKERQLQRAIVDSKNQVLELTMNLERSQMAYDQEQLKAEDFQSEKDRLSQEIERASAQLLEKESLREEAQKEHTLQKDANAALGESFNKLQEEIASLRKGQEAYLLQMKDLLRRRDWLKSMQNEYEGFSAPVKAVMKLVPQYGTRIRGTLSDILRVDEKYMTAMDMAMGQSVQNIVVEDTQTAKALVEYLRNNDIGRATFLPVDSVIGRSHSQKDEEIRRMEGVLGFADEIIKADPIYQKILQRQLGNVVITETFEQARAVSRRYGSFVRVVTLKGDIFNIGGSITGGSTNKKGSGLLSRRKEIDTVNEQLKDLRDKADQLQKDLSAKNEERFSLEKELRESTTLLNQKQEALSEAAMAERQASFEKERLEGELDSLIKSEESRLQNEDGNKHLLEEKRSNLTKEEEKVSEQEKALQKLQESLKENQKELDAKREEEGRLRVALASIRQQREFMLQSVQWEENEIENLSKEADEILENREEMRQKDTQSQEEIKTIEASILKRNQEIEEHSKEKEVLENRVHEMDQKREISLKEVEETLQQYSQLEKEQVRLENQLQRAERDLNDLTERMWNDYEITIGAARDLASRGFQDDEKLKEAAALSKTKRHQNIVRLKNAIKELGPVNVNAVQEYKALTERIAFLTKQRDDILESKANLEAIIERMTKRMEVQFEEGFKKIALSFDKVFKQMFGGGQAVLRLTEGDESLEAGIEINVQPPGKKLQSMMLLSGGERALTAIALLFAIQELNPAPFCILDEIEAALDDANVDRYAHFLEEMCHNTQFIIITHRKGTMAVANTMYGVTMEEKGVSKCVSVQFGNE